MGGLLQHAQADRERFADPVEQNPCLTFRGSRRPLPIRPRASVPRSAIRDFIERSREGRTVGPDLLAFIARLLSDNLNALTPEPAHRPSAARDTKFLAWFAVNCDPGFQALPRTRDGRFQAVADLLSCDASKAQRDAATFAKGRLGSDIFLIAEHGARYARLKAMPWPEAAETFLDWYFARPRRSRPAMRNKSA